MRDGLHHFFLSIVFLSLSASAVFAQQGTVTGTIYDSDGRETLPGANIYLSSSISTGTVSDLDGAFVLTGVPVGTQVVVVSFAGFEKQEIPVEVSGSEPVEISVQMAPAAIMGEEVIVTAQALGQAKAINQQLNSDAIANFISADKIKELPDVNAAEAISRLPGVAINRNGGEGSTVVVRGLDPKFTAISINGVRLPATSGTDRSVDLSLISPELLSGIELFKSPTPDMDGDALGGSINLNIIKAPKDRKIVVQGLGGYNDIRQTYTDYKGTVSFTDRFFKDKVGITATGNIERFNRGGQTIGQSWGDDMGTVLDTVNNIFRQEGNSLSYNYREEQRLRQNGSLGIDFALGSRTDMTLLGIFSRTARDRFEQVESYEVNSSRVTFEPNVIQNSIELWSGSLSTRHNFNAFSIEWGAAYSTLLGETPQDNSLIFWTEGESFQPEVQGMSSRDNPQNFDKFLAVDSTSAYFQGASRSTSSNQEDILSAFLDFSVPFTVAGNISAKLKFGGKVRSSTRERQFEFFRNQQGFNLRPNSDFAVLGNIPALGAQENGLNYFSIANFVQPGALNITRADGTQGSLLSNFREEQIFKYFDLLGNEELPESRFERVNNYTLDENVYAGYAMLKVNFGKKLTAIPGFRFEQSDNFYTGIYADLDGQLGQSGTLRTDEVDRDYGNFLPHLHLKYQANDWFDIRASYSKTLARPDFNYVVPSTLVNRAGDLRVTQGNPNLEASVATNLDLYLTAYKGKWGLFSIGIFEKQIADAFYPFIVGLNTPELVAEYGFPEAGFGNALLTTYRNSPESRVRGIEFDLQSNLNWLPKPLNGLVLNFNYSLLQSETVINSFTEETTITGRPPILIRTVTVTPFQREVDLIGQASSILNGSLGYDLGKFSARASISYQGNKLSGYSSNADKDRFNKGFWRSDAVVKYRFTPDFNVFVNLNNLTNQQDINFFRSERFVTSTSTYGTTSTVGMQYTFR